MHTRFQHKRNAILAALAMASLSAPWAAKTGHRTAGTTGSGGTAATTPRVDTAYNPQYWDSTAGGTGPGSMPGRGGSSLDSAYGRDTLWSSPQDQPATPGTGLPNSPGSGYPGTGGPGSSGNGGSGAGGSGMGGDSSYRNPGNGPSPSAPNNGGTPRDSIGVPDWMERG